MGLTKRQQIELLQKKLDAANEQLAAVDNTLKEQYLNIATNIVSEIKSWFQDQSKDCTIFLNYDDVYDYLDNLCKDVKRTAPKYIPSVLCQLSMALSETRRQLADQRIQSELDKRMLKERLNSIYGAKCSGKLPKTPAMQIERLKAEVKQAQIDVLNKLKKKTHNYYPSIDYYCLSQHVVLVRDIDELLAEVKNDNSKSN